MKDIQARRSERAVTSPQSLQEWRDYIHGDEGLHDDPLFRLLLLSLSSPEMMDRENWVVPYRVAWLSEASGVSEQTIRNAPGDYDGTRDERVQSSRYVEQIGTCEWDDSRGHTRESPLLELVMPEEAADE